MTFTTWLRGAEWRKWDLHVHSPASGNFSGEYNQFIIQLGNADCDVVGINDYCSVAGYREVLRHLRAAPGEIAGNQGYRDAIEKLRLKTLIPVVECRMSNVIVGRKGTGPNTNFHMIFDPAIDPENIETFIKGQHVGGSQIGSRYNDKRFLLDDVVLDFKAVCRQLRADRAFADRHLIWLPYDEYGGIDNIDPTTHALFKEDLIREAHIMGSSNARQISFFLWNDRKFSEDQYRGWFGKRKPCIKGSDSHGVDDDVGKLKDENSKPIDRHCWIKADPTFAGLKQITIEPEERVYIGKLPPKLDTVRNSPTRFVQELAIGKTADADTADTWFDCRIPLSPDLVAIIGNKGSGKSALADVLALAGNAQCQPQDFSFLHKDRFCERAGRTAKQFEAVASWHDLSKVTVSLNGKPDPNGVEYIRYVPQAYLEKVCTETEPGETSAFQKELRQVIFSHISLADRPKRETLDELIQFRTEELEGRLGTARQEIGRLNAELIRLEERGSAAHRAQLEASLAAKKQELRAHDDIKPAEVMLPQAYDEDHQAAVREITDRIDHAREALASLNTAISQRQAEQILYADQLALIAKVEAKLDTLSLTFDRLRGETEDDLTSVGVAFSTVVQLTIDKEPMLARRVELETARAGVADALNPENAEGLPARRAAVLQVTAEVQEQLDAPNKLFQAYQEALRVWKERAAAIEGAAGTQDTLKWYDAQLAWLDKELPGEIARVKEERLKTARSIHQSIATIRDIYREMFGPVQELISNSNLIKEGFKLAFESRIADRVFQRDFFNKFINQNASGSFYKNATSFDEVRAQFDFNNADDAIGFVENVLSYLQKDMRSAQMPAMEMSAQLRRNATLKSLYDFLWSFEYLKPEYSLKLDGKDLGHLSPGERGTLLLMFYLLVDKSDKPIIVDQPEENLDSQTVYKLLRPIIKDVKKRRQIIMVTHSPNIAVVCDAEQIIHAHIERAQGNRVVYTSGAIEAPDINRHLVNVLEGTRPAFDNRETKYQPEDLAEGS